MLYPAPPGEYTGKIVFVTCPTAKSCNIGLHGTDANDCPFNDWMVVDNRNLDLFNTIKTIASIACANATDTILFVWSDGMGLIGGIHLFNYSNITIKPHFTADDLKSAKAGIPEQLLKKFEEGLPK